MRPTGPNPGFIGAIIAGYKSTVSKQINQERKTPGVKIWHHNYYEHVIRNEKEYEEIANDILNNPLQWHLYRFIT